MSCCGSLFVNLGGGGGGGTVNTGVLQIAGGVALDNNLRFVEDQNGTDSILQLSTNSLEVNASGLLGIKFATILGAYTAIFSTSLTPALGNYAMLLDGNTTYLNANTSLYLSRANGTQILLNSSGLNVGELLNVGTGTLTNNGQVTIKGSGGNIASFRNASNVEIGVVNSSGYLVFDTFQWGLNVFRFASDGQYFKRSANGIWCFQNDAQNNFTRNQFGGTTTDFPAFSFTNTPGTIAATDATGANLIPFSAEDFTSANLTSGTLQTARPMQFGDKANISDAGLFALGLTAQIAVEHNGNIYYIPCSTSLIS
jgi:hypothetical protein